MALLHATQLFAGPITSATPVVVYTVAAGKRIIVREADVFNASASTVNPQLRVDTAGTIWQPPLTVFGTAGASAQWHGWIVLGPGQTLSLSNQIAARTTDWVLSGSIYTI